MLLCHSVQTPVDARVAARQRDFLRDFAEQFDELRHVVLVAVVRLPTDRQTTNQSLTALPVATRQQEELSVQWLLVDCSIA